MREEILSRTQQVGKLTVMEELGADWLLGHCAKEMIHTGKRKFSFSYIEGGQCKYLTGIYHFIKC